MKNKIILFIDTSERKKLTIKIYNNKFFSQTITIIPGELSQKIIQIIEKFLKQKEYNFKDIAKIVCYTGPGSYTSLRIGVLTANTIAVSLNIPVYAIKKNQTFEKFVICDKNKDKNFKKPIDAYYQQAID